MTSIPDELRDLLRRHGQERVLAWWQELGDGERANLVSQLQSIDFDELRQLYQEREQRSVLPADERLSSLPRPSDDAARRAAHKGRGEQAFREGKVAFLVVAGGQGSRLGFEHPKGMYPVGPVSHKSLFQIHAEKALALQKRYQAPLPFLVMTSPATDAETRAFFAEHQNFGLGADDVHYFRQGTMPALDLETGRLLMETKGSLFLSPDGHGGTLTGLADSGLLDALDRRGIQNIFYFQVDNPLVNLADTGFLGRHLEHNAYISSKVIEKESPADKLGNFVLVDGRCAMIEYSDLTKEQAERRDPSGQLFFWAGNPAIHLADLGFLRKVTQGALRIPWHVAKKRVPCLDENGNPFEPVKENALKFERFIFDVLPMAERWTATLTDRKEFAPLKNAEGADSPVTVRQALCDQAADWLVQAGVQVPRNPDGHAAALVEVSPLYALDAEELARKVDKNLRIDKAVYLS
ncbi:MAG: UDPGP type 1 family protein [Gemmataceae bacterium]|nr:UDPGP type 1 family protein [Gemmataceae bacterium]